MVSSAEIRQALAGVQDPELRYPITELGLVYDVQCTAEAVVVTMTLTSPTCPLQGHFETVITDALTPLVGEVPVQINITFSPPWSLQRATPEVQAELALLGIGSVQW